MEILSLVIGREFTVRMIRVAGDLLNRALES